MLADLVPLRARARAASLLSLSRVANLLSPLDQNEHSAPKIQNEVSATSLLPYSTFQRRGKNWSKTRKELVRELGKSRDDTRGVEGLQGYRELL